MSWGSEAVETNYRAVANASDAERGRFIADTYKHLFMAIATFIALEVLLLNLPFTGQLVQAMTGSGVSWLVVLGLFMAASWIANAWARNSTSLAKQYAGLGLYIVAEAVIFVPLLYVASVYGGPEVIPTAGIITAVTFTGLTAIVFFTRANFSFLGPFLAVAGIAAIGVIVCSLIFGFSLGILFTGLMILFACGYILYDTSKVLHEYAVGQHVAAALALFASVALLFWYVLRIVMAMRR